MSMVRDRKAKPAPWPWNFHNVARDCRWAVKGLVLAWPMWETKDTPYTATGLNPAHDPITGRHPILTSDAGSFADTLGWRWNSHARGTVIQTKVTGSAVTRAVSPDMIGFPTKDSTTLFHYRKTDTTRRLHAEWGTQPFTAGREWHVLGDYFWDGNFYFDFGGQVDGVSRLIAPGLTYGDDIWVLTTGPRGMEIWQNGFKRASNSATPTRTNDPTDKLGLNGLAGNFSLLSDLMESGVVLVYDHQKSESEIMALSLDPWTPFRREFRRPIALSVSSFPVQFDGLRAFYGAVVNDLCLVAEADAPAGMGGVLKIDKNGTIYAAYLVETSDPNASSVRVQTSTGVKAIRLKT